MKSAFSRAVASIDTKLKDSVSFLKDMEDAGWEKVILVGDIRWSMANGPMADG